VNILKKNFIRLISLVCGVLAAWIISGCGPVSATSVKAPDNVHVIQYNNPDTYPQMFNVDMIENKAAIEAKYNVKFIGAYTYGDQYEWIFWVINKTTGECEATFIYGDGDSGVDTCENAYLVYRMFCKQVGNCM